MLSGFNPETIQDLEGARQAIAALLNLVETLKQENQELRAEVQRLRDEINRLKGEQGKPEIKGDKPKDHSSEKERHASRRVGTKATRSTRIVIHREQKLYVDKNELPEDAQFKGYEETVVQDIRLTTDNVCFVKEKYYSPS
jgi:predicted RNase H-like nuclease (RuvC/YqgF family)